MPVPLHDPGEEWTWVRDEILDGQWPEANEDKLAELGDIWRQIGAALSILQEYGDGAIRQVLSAYGGEVGPEVSGKWSTLSGNLTGLAAIIEHAGEASTAAHRAAEEVATAKHHINEQITATLTQLHAMLVEGGGGPAGLANIRNQATQAGIGVIANGQNAIGAIVQELAGTLGALRVTEFEPLPGSRLAGNLEQMGGIQGNPAGGGLPEPVNLAGGVAGALADAYKLLSGNRLAGNIAKWTPWVTGFMSAGDELLTNEHSPLENGIRAGIRLGYAGLIPIPFAGAFIDEMVNYNLESFDIAREGWHEGGWDGARQALQDSDQFNLFEEIGYVWEDLEMGRSIWDGSMWDLGDYGMLEL